MKRHIAFLLALLFYASILPWHIEAAQNISANILRANDAILKGPWVDVRAYGTALTEVPIQAAINSLDNTVGGTIYIPPGTYVITNNIYIYGKSNVRLVGAGRDVTIIDGSNATEQSNAPYSGQLAGILNVWGTDAGSGTSEDYSRNVSNITISDFSIKGSNSETRDQHLLSVGRVTGFTMERIKIYHPNAREVCAFYNQIQDLTVRDGFFIGKGDTVNGLNSMLNTNTITVRNVHIENNRFDNCVTGPFILGDGITIKDNKFRDCRNGINVVESNGTTMASGKGIVISGNTFNGLGRNSNISEYYGITAKNSTKIFDDNTVDSGTIISENVFIDSYCDNGALSLIHTNGNSIITNNFAVGLRSNVGASSTFILINTDETTPNRTTLSGNVLLKKPSGYNINYGVKVTDTDNTYVYMSGGFLQAAVTNILRTGTKPYMSFDGVIISDGNINIGWSGIWNDSGELDNLPLYGSTDGTISTITSKNVITTNNTFDNTTTPSVKGQNIWKTKASTTVSITAFDDSQYGQEITIYCSDNTATIVNNVQTMRLAGGVNFVCTGHAIIRLLRQDVITTGQWTEVGRSVN